MDELVKRSLKKHFRRYGLLFLLIVFVCFTLIIDLLRISTYQVIPMRPAQHVDCQQDRVYYDLVKGKPIKDWGRLDGTLEYIRGEYDCADFRLVNLLRILYEYDDQIPPPTRAKIEDVLFNFRYWWDEPGENSMCYWSENHQILFASAELLVGQLYPDTVFPSSGLTGKDHVVKANQRIRDWLAMRWNYGFIEFNSGVYYKEDIGGLINIIDFAEEDELVKQTQIVMDLLFFDVALQNIKNMFVSASGRAYKGNRQGGPSATLGGLTEYYWGNGQEIGPGIMYGMMVTKNYSLPPVLKAIAQDSNAVTIKQSHGLDLTELRTEGYYGVDNRSMMMQWGMEAFTNPNIVRNSLAHIRSCRMFTNEFLQDFKIIDFTLLDWLHLEPTIVRLLNPQSNGVVIQRGNVYTYKTQDYSMYTAQAYHPGTYGDQQHVFGANIGNHFSIFHTHPALDADVKHQSPNYWVGYGHLPHVAQASNVSLAIYKIPETKGFMEMDLLDYTHAYIPRDKFDTLLIDKNYILGSKGETYCALIGAQYFMAKEGIIDNIIQPGKRSYWIVELGSKREDSSFETFCQRILNNEVCFDSDKLELRYQSRDKQYQLVFGRDFTINGDIANTQYPRFDTPYCQARRKAQTITITHKGHSWHLDFQKLKRGQ